MDWLVWKTLLIALMSKGLWLEGKGILPIDEVTLDLWNQKVILKDIKYKDFIRAKQICQFCQTVAPIPGSLQNWILPRGIELAPFRISLLIGSNPNSILSNSSSVGRQAFCFSAATLGYYPALLPSLKLILIMIFANVFWCFQISNLRRNCTFSDNDINYSGWCYIHKSQCYEKYCL